MKLASKSLIPLVVIAVLATAVPAVAEEATGGLRYSITVTKFENQAGWHGQWNLGDAWDTVLTDMLNQSGKFIVLGETDMRAAALDEQDFAASGRTAGGAKAPVTGQMTPAQLLDGLFKAYKIAYSKKALLGRLMSRWRGVRRITEDIRILAHFAEQTKAIKSHHGT